MPEVIKTRSTHSERKLVGSVIAAAGWIVVMSLQAVAQTTSSAISESAPANQLPSVPAPRPATAEAGTAEVERVIVTGSNIPTAEEVGPNPVDTYRREDIQ